MDENYRNTEARLIANAPFEIDTEIQIMSRIPTSASSDFLTNKEQGEWAESIIHSAINEHSQDFIAVRYGRDDSLAAGDDGFKAFYESYIQELNVIGKKPDILIFRREDFPDIESIDINNEAVVKSAVAAIEVRSSSFLSQKYAQYMENRNATAIAECQRLRQLIMTEPLASELRNRNHEVFHLIEGADIGTFRELDFRLQSWSSSEVLRNLSQQLKELKKQIKILHKRDYLSITPKLEDLSLINRWIQHFNVKHYYLQVFFDKAYLISFKNILEIISESDNENIIFSVERDVRNQRKTTLKIDIQVGSELMGRIDLPAYTAALKELDRGRLLFYVTFSGGKGYLDPSVLSKELS